MGLIFLLAVSGILTYLTIQTRQQNALRATATAQANATHTVVAGQTQQARATQAAQTAVASTATAQVVKTVQNAQATATAITSATPLLNDPLSGQDANNWPDDGTNCAFQNNVYFVTASKPNTLQPCIAATPSFGDVAIQIDVTLITAADAGLLFRANASQNQFYDFEITSQGRRRGEHPVKGCRAGR